MRLFEHKLRLDLVFQELAIEKQQRYEAQSNESLRLRVATLRALSETSSLPPRGPPLLPGDAPVPSRRGQARRGSPAAESRGSPDRAAAEVVVGAAAQARTSPGWGGGPDMYS
jgi:hypothetical protein